MIKLRSPISGIGKWYNIELLSETCNGFDTSELIVLHDQTLSIFR